MTGTNTLDRPHRGLSDDLLRQAREWGLPTDDVAVVEGGSWTWMKMKRAARFAARRTLFSEGWLRDDPVQLAEAAIACAIVEDPDITWVDAIAAGQAEIRSTANWVRKNSGGSINGTGERFWVYWLDRKPDFLGADACVEPMTLAAVMRTLPERHVETLILAAFTDTTEEAARIAGILPTSFSHRLARARRAALRLWFDGEEPPSLDRLPVHRRRVIDTCPQGHEMTGENIYWEKSRTGRLFRRCRTCRHESNGRATP